MTDRPLLVVTIEGLARSSLGCFGSSWNQTPTIDRIAAEGCVWDRCVATADDPQTVLFRSVAGDPRKPASERDWANAWKYRGSVELLSDVPIDASGWDPSPFERMEIIPWTVEQNVSPENDVQDTALAQLFAAAIARAAADDSWSLLWLNSGAMTRIWDAPRDLIIIDEEEPSDEPLPEDELIERELEEQHYETIEPLPPTFDQLEPPSLRIEEHAHPDLVTSWMRTYACQVRLLDLLLELLLESLEDLDPRLILLGTSGFRLGQDRWLGHRVGPLRSPDIHLPLIYSDGGPLRFPQLTTPETLASLLCADAAIDQNGRRNAMCTEERWITPTSEAPSVLTESDRAESVTTTADWFHVRQRDGADCLFSKPDDVDDINDVARLRDDVLEEFEDATKKPH